MVILYDANEARYDHRADVAIGRKSSGRSAVQAFRLQLASPAFLRGTFSMFP